MTYDEARSLLNDRDTHQLRGTATVLRRVSPTSIAVRYHDTDIVTFHADGRVILDNGDYYTVTTKRKMNEYCGEGYVFARKTDWFVSLLGQPAIPFKTGMNVGATA